MKKRLVLLLAGVVTLLFLTTPQTPLAETMAVYKVFLVNAEGTPASQPASIKVSFYDSKTGGSPYWSETQTVTPDSGLYILMLGKTNSFNLSLDIPYYVGVEIGGSETAPRLTAQGAGSFSKPGVSNYNQELNAKYQWLDINVQ